MNEAFPRAFEQHEQKEAGADKSAQELLDKLKAGDRMNPTLISELLTALKKAEFSAALDSHDEELLERVNQIWDLPVWDVKPHSNRVAPSPEYKERINEIAAAIIPDLEFVTVHGKAPNQGEDYSSAPVYQKHEGVKLNELGKAAMQHLPPKLRVAFDGRAVLEQYNGRFMMLVEHPTDPEMMLGAYLIHNTTRDRSSRYADGSAYLDFALKKDNKLLDLLQDGKLNPSDFFKAMLHAGVALHPESKYALQIFLPGKGRNVVLDPKNLTITEYSGSEDEGERVMHSEPDDYLKKMKMYAPERAIHPCESIPGFTDSTYGNELKEYLQRGAFTPRYW